MLPELLVQFGLTTLSTSRAPGVTFPSSIVMGIEGTQDPLAILSNRILKIVKKFLKIFEVT